MAGGQGGGKMVIVCVSYVTLTQMHWFNVLSLVKHSVEYESAVMEAHLHNCNPVACFGASKWVGWVAMIYRRRDWC